MGIYPSKFGYLWLLCHYCYLEKKNLIEKLTVEIFLSIFNEKFLQHNFCLTVQGTFAIDVIRFFDFSTPSPPPPPPSCVMLWTKENCRNNKLRHVSLPLSHRAWRHLRTFPHEFKKIPFKHEILNRNFVIPDTWSEPSTCSRDFTFMNLHPIQNCCIRFHVDRNS